MPMIRNSAKALVLKGGALLLNTHLDAQGQPYYDLPGGGQRPMETMEEAVVREVWEETGLRVEPVRFAALAEEIFTNEGMQSRYPAYCHRAMHIFLVRVLSEDAGPVAEMDFQQTGSRWVAPEEAEELPLVPLQLRGRVREVLEAAHPVYLGSLRRDDVCM